MQASESVVKRRQTRVQLAGTLVILAMAILFPLLGHVGFDFKEAYRGDTLAGTYGNLTMNPWPAYWLFYPFALLPVRWGALLWNLVGAVGYLYALRRFNCHHLWIALSVPCIWTFYAGQFEGFLALGLVLGLTAPPIWAGFGVTLLSFKPQFGLLAILFILYERKDWRLLVIPAVVYILSLLYWGFWLDEWLANLTRAASDTTNTSFYPYALILIPLLFVFRDLKIWLIIQSLIMPYYAIYTIAPILTLRWKYTDPFIVIATWLANLLVPVEILAKWRLMAVIMVIALLIELWTLYRQARLDKQSESPVAEVS